MPKIITQEFIDLYNQFYTREDVLNQRDLNRDRMKMRNGQAFTSIFSLIHEMIRAKDFPRRTARLDTIFGAYVQSNVKSTKALL